MTDAATASKSHWWRVLSRVVLFMFACAVGLIVAAPFTPKLPGRWPELVIGSFTSVWTFALTWLFVRWEGLRLNDVGASTTLRSLPRLVCGFLIGSLLVALTAMFSAAAGDIHWVRSSTTNVSATLIALVAYFVLSCREEFAFHGYPLRRLEQPFGVWGAQLFVAFVFAAEHRAGGWTWSQALLGAAVGSLLFGMASIATRGLAVPIGIHAAWNFGEWILGLKGEPGLWQAAIPEGHDHRAELVRRIGYLTVMSAATLAFWLWHCFWLKRGRVNRTPMSTHDSSR